MSEVENIKPWFNNATDTMMQEARAVMDERGGQYGDSWRDCQWLALQAVERIIYSPERIIGFDRSKDNRAIALAVLVDVKYQRLQGGYKEDTLIDLVNYINGLAFAVRELKQ